MRPPLEMADLPADAIEVGRILDAWGVQGWFKVLPHSASPEALFSCKRWYLLPPERTGRPQRPLEASDTWTQPLLLRVRQAKTHADSVVASSEAIADRNAAESLKGARVLVPRSSFPSLPADEYYWVDLIGLQVRNREGLALGQVRELLSTGPQTVLVLQAQEGGVQRERMIPFVSTFVDQVDTASGTIHVDWQPDY